MTDFQNGIIINGHIYGLVDDAAVDSCDRCALLEKCTDFWSKVENENLYLCRFLYDDKAAGKRFQEQNV